MQYNFNGKVLNITDDEIDHFVNKLGISQEEAIEIWLDDNGYLDNEEAEELTQKAKDNKITQTIHQAAGGGKDKKKPRENPIKENIIQTLFETVVDRLSPEARIINKTKLIEFDYEGEHYKLDLIQQRKKK